MLVVDEPLVHGHILWDKVLQGTLHADCKQAVKSVTFVEDRKWFFARLG